MIKVFIFLICIISFISPAFARNLLQQEYELNNSETEFVIPINYNKLYLIKEDYYGYLSGKKSIYGGIIYVITDIQKSNISNKELNLQYLNLAKIKIEKIASIQNSNLDNNIRLNYLSLPIIIEDSDYQQLTKETKETIRIVNSILSMD